MPREDERRRVEAEKRRLQDVLGEERAAELAARADGGEFDDDLDDWFFNTDENGGKWVFE